MSSTPASAPLEPAPGPPLPAAVPGPPTAPAAAPAVPVVPVAPAAPVAPVAPVAAPSPAPVPSPSPAQALGPLFEGFPDGVIVIDPKGVIVAANARARGILSETGRPVEGTSLLEAFSFPAQAEQLLQDLHEKPSGGGTEIEAELEGAEGRRFLVAFSRLDSTTPFVRGYVLVLRDVTRERRREQIRITREKLAAVSQLAAGVAHEFNNIMASLYGFAQLTRADPGFVPELVSAIESFTERSREITKRLRAFAPEPGGPLASVDLSELLEAVVERLKGELLGRRIEVERRYRKVPPTLLNPREMTEVFESLVQNAIQAIVRNGRITVEIEAEPSHIRVRIGDTGFGIAKEHLTRVFEPFFTIKEAPATDAGPGAGLGLAVAYQHVRRLNGDIWVESEIGKGTTFTVRLPIRVERRRQQRPDVTVERRRELASARQKNILAVDDEETMLKLLGALLEEHHVVTASSGREAVAALKKGPFDYVILDLLLPGELDGFSVFDEISRRDRGAKIILLTGRVEDDRLREYAARAYGYLRKPFGIKDIHALVV